MTTENKEIRQMVNYLVRLARRINDRLDVDAAWSHVDVEMVERAADMLMDNIREVTRAT